MAIPTTCPGCAAVFEVPDNLAGKTIRCTSCKAQMSVPAAGAGGSPGAGKKPFGWANGAPAGAAKAAVDDDDIPVVTPSGAAKPAAVAKPVAKPAVAKATPVEQAKPKPAPAKAALTAKTSSAKKTRDDDDDDDDDDDAPKAKKKKKKPTADNSGMFLLIGGGVLGLAAIAGLAFFLLSGDGKPTETAKNDSNANANTNGNGANDPGAAPVNVGGDGTDTGGGMPGGGMPGGDGTDMGGEMPGGGQPVGGNNNMNFGGVQGLERLGTLGAWANFTGDGFTAEFPGTPEKQNFPQGPITLKVTGVVKKYDKAVVVMTMQMPTAAHANIAVNAMGQEIARKQPGSVVKPSMIDGQPAKEIEIKEGGGSGVLRYLAVKDRVYMFMAGGDIVNGQTTMPYDSINRFMKSVKLTYNGNGGNVAVGGPGGMPGDPTAMPEDPGYDPGGATDPNMPVVIDPTMPPGGDPNFPPPMPGGGTPGMPTQPGFPPPARDVPGKLKAKIPTFYTGAFDAEKKELFVVGLRMNGARQAGLIQRYSLPDFRLMGTLHIPSVATRAVIDAKKELLYVTTAPSTMTQQMLGREQFDRPVLMGDIAIYDLAQFRSGKIEEKSEFKPIATVQIGKSIRDILLTEDGKSLFVLTQTNLARGQVQSAVVAINTADRKAGKAKTLPDPVWTMILAPDGKNIGLVGVPTAANKTASLATLDAETLTLMPGGSTLPEGGAYDTAISRDGRIVVSVPKGNDKAMDLLTLDPSGGATQALRPGLGSVSNNGYIEFTPDGKFLIASSQRPSGYVQGNQAPRQWPGFDVYEVSDQAAGEKKVASMKMAGSTQVGGTFLLSPDSEFIVFNTGAVLSMKELGGSSSPGGSGPGGPGGPIDVNGGGGFIPPPMPGMGGGIEPDILVPGDPGGGPGPGGFVPPPPIRPGIPGNPGVRPGINPVRPGGNRPPGIPRGPG